MSWYDTFAHFYDPAIEKIYRPFRRLAFESLDGRGGAAGGRGPVVLDLACGTGQNFPCLFERLGDGLHLIGVDVSAGMLSKARRRAEKQDLENLYLLEADARELTHERIGDLLDQTAAQGSRVDYVVCTLGLSAIPDWQRVFRSAFGLLRPGGQFLIMDVWAERWVPQTTWVQLLARADLKRKVWQPLEQVSQDFELRFLEGSPHLHGGRLFVATGSRG